MSTGSHCNLLPIDEMGGKFPKRLKIKFITLDASPLSSGERELIVILVSKGIIAKNIMHSKSFFLLIILRKILIH